MSQISNQVNKTFQDCMTYLRSVYGSISFANRSHRLILTISISGAIGVSLAAFYHTVWIKRKKQTLIKSRRLIDTVSPDPVEYVVRRCPPCTLTCFVSFKIPELKSPNVRIKNPMHVESVLSNFIHSGKQSLQVVSDFDRTISMCSADGIECMTSNGKSVLSKPLEQASC